ncbi:tail terminator [Microbacterium phage Finny]|uniref:Tail terminator n=1 Tax=Microbacterium phage Finny TaxID=2590878 RepID=A0A4Y6EAP4_9CAUD|nr:tail terminator [Microbacterium phage Finny]WNN95805.1 tail terminator [Microbacterium phage ChikPic]
MNLQSLKATLEAALAGQAEVVVGFPKSNAKAPFVAIRPLTLIEGDEGTAITGDFMTLDDQTSAYCAGASVEASYNLALLVMGACQATRVDGYVLTTSMGYSGALVEGLYESQVTIQHNRGGI